MLHTTGVICDEIAIKTPVDESAGLIFFRVTEIYMPLMSEAQCGHLVLKREFGCHSNGNPVVMDDDRSPALKP